MQQSSFRPKSFGSFLEAVRTPSEDVRVESQNGSDDPGWMKTLKAFGNFQALDANDLTELASLSKGDFRVALTELIKREFVTVSGTVVALTPQGRDTLGLLL